MTKLAADLQAEVNWIKALARNPEHVHLFLDRCSLDDLTYGPARSLTETVLGCLQEGIEPGRSTVASRLQHNNNLKRAELEALRRQLASESPSGVDVDVALDTIAKMAAFRRINGGLSQFLSSIQEKPITAIEQVPGLLSYLMSLCEGADTEEANPKRFLDSLEGNEWQPPEPTGYDALDRALGGGLHPQTLTTIGAVTGGGKSTIVCNLVCNRVHMGRHSLVIGPEVSKRRYTVWMIANLSTIPHDIVDKMVDAPEKYARGREDLAAFYSAKEVLGRYVKIYGQVTELDDVLFREAQYEAEAGARPVVFLDSLDFLECARLMPRYRDWSYRNQILIELHNRGKRRGAARVITAQLTEAVGKYWREYNRPPENFHEGFFGGRFIAQRSDNTIHAGRHNGKDRNGMPDPALRFRHLLYVTKCRWDQQEVPGDPVELKFDPATKRFVEAEAERQEIPF